MIILKMSLSASFLILAIICLRLFFLNQLPKQLFKTLWILVTLKLLIPISIPFKYSFISILNRIMSGTVIKKNILDYSNINSSAYIDNNSSAFIKNNISGLENLNTNKFSILLNNLELSLLSVSLVLVVILIIYYIRHYESYSNSKVIYNDSYYSIIKAENIRRTVIIKENTAIKSPLTYGILKPVILLPPSANNFNNRTMELILLHEIVHIKKFDQLYKMLLALIVCVHWFNPIVWIMYFVANKDIELMCDNVVMSKVNGDIRKEYAHMLITLADNCKRKAILINHFSYFSFEERIKSIMLSKSKSRMQLVVASLVVATIAIIFATNSHYAADYTYYYKQGEKECFATVGKDKTLMNITLAINNLFIVGREKWSAGDVIRLKIDTDKKRDLSVGIIPAENMEDGWKYDDYGHPIAKDVVSKNATLEFVVPKSGEYGIYIFDTFTAEETNQVIGTFVNLLNHNELINITLEVNREFKNPLDK